MLLYANSEDSDMPMHLRSHQSLHIHVYSIGLDEGLTGPIIRHLAPLDG